MQCAVLVSGVLRCGIAAAGGRQSICAEGVCDVCAGLLVVLQSSQQVSCSAEKRGTGGEIKQCCSACSYHGIPHMPRHPCTAKGKSFKARSTKHSIIQAGNTMLGCDGNQWLRRQQQQL